VPFAQLAYGLRHGISSSWYASGQAERIEPYNRDQLEGELLVFFPSGQLRRQAQYQAGRELSCRCYDPQGQVLPYLPYEQPPLYPGGIARLNQEINKRLRRVPELMRTSSFFPLRLSISFLVLPDGRLSEPQLEVPSHVPALDRAVLAAVQGLSRPWQPGRREGQAVTFRYRLPFEYRSASTLYESLRQP
jgi:protein TonB